MTADARHGGPEHALDWLEHEAMQRKALALATQMNDWLGASASVYTPIYHPGAPGSAAGSDLVEWCRSARDILEQVARG